MARHGTFPPELKDTPLTIDKTGAALPHASCIVITTDGSCQPNPGPGGCAAIIDSFADRGAMTSETRVDGASATTNNQMELLAAIIGLEAIAPVETRPILVCSDSEYVVLGMNERLTKWIASGWRNAARKPVPNRKLWERLQAQCEGRDVSFQWVQGHAGNAWNELADQQAAQECERWKAKADEQRFAELFGQPA